MKPIAFYSLIDSAIYSLTSANVHVCMYVYVHTHNTNAVQY